MICFIAFISYTFYLTAGDIYVSPYGNDKAAVHANLSSRLWNKPSRIAITRKQPEA